MNEHMVGPIADAANAAITIPIKDFRPQSGGSGLVPDGNYKLKILEAAWVDHKSVPGAKNLKVRMAVEAPEEYKGVSITVYQRAPIGDPSTDEKLEKSLRRTQQMMASIFDGLGRFEELIQNDTVDLSPASIIGHSVFAYLDSAADSNGTLRSGVAWYIMAKEYAEAPGPAKGLSQRSTGPAVTTGTALGGTLPGAQLAPATAVAGTAPAVGNPTQQTVTSPQVTLSPAGQQQQPLQASLHGGNNQTAPVASNELSSLMARPIG